MAYCRGLSLLNLLCESPTVVASRDVLRPELVKPNGPVKRAINRLSWRIDTAEVSKVLRAALKEDPPPSATQVMKRLTCGEVVVRCHFSEICSELAQRYAQYRVVRAIARKMHAAEEVRRVAHELHAKGIKLTRQHIRPHLSSSDYLNLKEGRAALDKVRSQLACKVSNKGAS
jgi:predicted TIM-barrel fold metal-dependent hydrolase